MSEMVERVAKAIYDTWAKNRLVSEPWDEVRSLGHSIVEEARSEARAAIEAMRKPTDEVGEALDLVPGGWGRGAWLNGIDAALGDVPK